MPTSSTVGDWTSSLATLALLAQEVQAEVCEHIGWHKLDHASVETLGLAYPKHYTFCTADCDYATTKSTIVNTVLNINEHRHSTTFYPIIIVVSRTLDNSRHLGVVVHCFVSS